jgi:iodotyrosine deiodinase
MTMVAIDSFVPLVWNEIPLPDMLALAEANYAELAQRRTTRHFSSRDVDRRLIELAILSGSTAPNGAHLQPWTWVAIRSRDLQAQLREAAEAEERKTYSERMPEAWSEVLEPLGTDAVKAHLTEAPWVVVLFRQKKRQRPNGEWGPTYYSLESCGIAAGMFIQAVHCMGLVTLTHTPSPMGFLRDLLGRPAHEEAMLVMPVGYPADDARVPDIHRKSLDEVAVFFDEQA